MSDRTGGIISFVVNGIQLEIEGSFSVQPHRFMRTSVQGVTGPAGHKREAAQPFFDGVCFYKSDVSLATLQGLESITAQLDLYNGKKFVLEEAAQVGEIELDAVEGTFPLRLEGTTCREL